MSQRTNSRLLVLLALGATLFGLGILSTWFIWFRNPVVTGQPTPAASNTEPTRPIAKESERLPSAENRTPPVATKESQRQLLEMALGAGGRAQISVNGKDKEVWQLKQLPQGEFHLQRLDLSQFTDLTADRMSLINDLELLTYLSLQRTNLTDAMLAENLHGLKRLTQLELGYTQISVKGLSCLKRLPSLESLSIEEAKLDSQGWALIAEQKGLKRLYLLQANLDDAGLKELSGLSNLVELNLTGTKISDAGLQHLQGMKQLNQLILLKTAVTEKGAKELAGHLPGCRIGYPGGIQQPK